MNTREIVSTPFLPVPMVIAWALVLSGCSITQLQHDGLEEPADLQSGVVNVDSRATGFTGGRVGWGRITIFYIPVVPIHIKSDESSDLMEIVSDALVAAGYTTRMADIALDGPLLKAHVDKARFNNYTWLAPIVPTWGRVSVTLRLETAAGQVLWEESFSERGTTFNFFDGYNIAATESITRLANSMVEAFSAREFSDALALAI